MKMDIQSRFAKEIKLTKPFRSSSHEATIAIIRTASCIRNGILRITREQGISVSQFNILRILRGAGVPLPTMEIAERMVEVEPGITRMLNRLEKKKLIERSRSPIDARSVLCAIKPEGLDVLSQLDGPIAEFEETYFSGLNEVEARALIATLAGICSNPIR